MTEDILQAKCIKIANELIPQTRGILYAIPNGAYLANKHQAMKLIATGMMPGVADLVLDISNKTHTTLKLELKLKSGKQSPAQLQWEKIITQNGHKYVIIKTISQFINTITEYLDIPNITLPQDIIEQYDNY